MARRSDRTPHVQKLYAVSLQKTGKAVLETSPTARVRRDYRARVRSAVLE